MSAVLNTVLFVTWVVEHHSGILHMISYHIIQVSSRAVPELYTN